MYIEKLKKETMLNKNNLSRRVITNLIFQNYSVFRFSKKGHLLSKL